MSLDTEENHINFLAFNYLRLPVVVFSRKEDSEQFSNSAFQFISEQYKKKCGNQSIKHLAKQLSYTLLEKGSDNLEVEINNGAYRHIYRFTANVVDEYVFIEGEDITELKKNQFLFTRANSLLEDYSKQMFELAYTDQLTTVPNRRALFNRFNELESSHKQFNCTVSFIDLDNFKRFNDSFGHDFGDQVLVIFSKHAINSIDESCYFARLGGEEFCLIQINKYDNSCFSNTKRLLQTIKTVKLVTPVGSSIGMSFSAGVAVFGKDGTTLDELLNKADKALYNAKNNGRSCIVKYDGS